MKNETVDEILESEEQEPYQSSSLGTIKDKLTSMETLGAGAAASYIPIKMTPSDSAERGEMVPDEISFGEAEINTGEIYEDAYDFWHEWIHGQPWETEEPLKQITYNSDKLGHYSVGYLGANLIMRGVDRATGEYDPKKVAIGGMMAAPLYAVAKEGMIEGGEGVQFDFESMDLWGDWAMDTAGAAHSVYNYHKRKTVEEGEEPAGLVGDIANKAGKTYGRAKNSAESYGNSVTSGIGNSLRGMKDRYLEDSPDDDMESLDEVFG